jgi:hypothetical protein
MPAIWVAGKAYRRVDYESEDRLLKAKNLDELFGAKPAKNVEDSS